jgi:hypothetical protein
MRVALRSSFFAHISSSLFPAAFQSDKQAKKEHKTKAKHKKDKKEKDAEGTAHTAHTAHARVFRC